MSEVGVTAPTTTTTPPPVQAVKQPAAEVQFLRQEEGKNGKDVCLVIIFIIAVVFMVAAVLLAFKCLGTSGFKFMKMKQNGGRRSANNRRKPYSSGSNKVSQAASMPVAAVTPTRRQVAVPKPAAARTAARATVAPPPFSLPRSAPAVPPPPVVLPRPPPSLATTTTTTDAVGGAAAASKQQTGGGLVPMTNGVTGSGPDVVATASNKDNTNGDNNNNSNKAEQKEEAEGFLVAVNHPNATAAPITLDANGDPKPSTEESVIPIERQNDPAQALTGVVAPQTGISLPVNSMVSQPGTNPAQYHGITNVKKSEDDKPIITPNHVRDEQDALSQGSARHVHWVDKSHNNNNQAEDGEGGANSGNKRKRMTTRFSTERYPKRRPGGRGGGNGRSLSAEEQRRQDQRIISSAAGVSDAGPSDDQTIRGKIEERINQRFDNAMRPMPDDTLARFNLDRKRMTEILQDRPWSKKRHSSWKQSGDHIRGDIKPKQEQRTGWFDRIHSAQDLNDSLYDTLLSDQSRAVGIDPKPSNYSRDAAVVKAKTSETDDDGEEEEEGYDDDEGESQSQSGDDKQEEEEGTTTVVE